MDTLNNTNGLYHLLFPWPIGDRFIKVIIHLTEDSYWSLEGICKILPCVEVVKILIFVLVTTLAPGQTKPTTTTTTTPSPTTTSTTIQTTTPFNGWQQAGQWVYFFSS